MKRVLAILLALTLLTTFLVACSADEPTPPAADATGDDIADDTAGDEADDTADVEEAAPPTADGEPFEVSIWLAVNEAVGNFYVDIMDRVAANHPGLTWNMTVHSWEDLGMMLIPAINAGAGPDVFAIGDFSSADMALVIEAGLLADLTPFAERYNWQDRYPDWWWEGILDISDGNLVRMHLGSTALGVFYNKAIFEENGISVPQTYDEFLAICQILQDAGVQPILLAGMDGWPYFHYQSMFIAAFDGRETWDNIIDNGGSFNSPGVVAAKTAFLDLINVGFIDSNINAIEYGDMNTMFTAMIPESPAMVMTGTWMMQEYYNFMGDNVGFFILPSAIGGAPMPVASIADGWAINAASEHKDISAEFLNILFSSEFAPYAAKSGMIIAFTDIDEDVVRSWADVNPLMRDAIVGFMNATNIAPNIDVLVPATINEATLENMQRLGGGLQDVETTVANIAEAYYEAFSR